MTALFQDILRHHSRPLDPLETGQAAILPRLEGVKAVLYDLLISGSGEVGTARQAACQTALVEALAAVGIDTSGVDGSQIELLFDVIEESHAVGQKAGIEYPEVLIDEVWRRVLDLLAGRGLIDPAACRGLDFARLAVEYESRANPIWPMPGAEDCLAELARRGLLLGIVSNAQFYTRELLPAFLGGEAEALGFDPQLQFYSYQHGQAKPGATLYRLAAEELCRRGIAASAVLYVGNDMLNDMLPASQVGFRTALFAGDARSLRLRPDDPRVDGLRPEIVLTRLADLAECLMME